MSKHHGRKSIAMSGGEAGVTLARLRDFAETAARAALLAGVLTLAGCGSYPASPHSAAGVRRLHADTTTLYARGLSDGEVAELSRLSRLRNLDFTAGWGVEEAELTDKGLALMAKRQWPVLETLHLGHCSGITDAGMVSVAKMNSVKWLSLMGSPHITDAGLKALLPMKNLEALDLRGCPEVTDQGLEFLARRKSWRTILLGGCPKVTARAIVTLQRRFPGTAIRADDQY
ncbi:MAG: hypothetical protein V4726_09465 [Verrucomicrobiota bacterium]